MQRPDGKGEVPPSSGASDTPQVAMVNFGPKYELHMAEKQKQLDSATSQYVQPLTCACMRSFPHFHEGMR